MKVEILSVDGDHVSDLISRGDIGYMRALIYGFCFGTGFGIWIRPYNSVTTWKCIRKYFGKNIRILKMCSNL